MGASGMSRRLPTTAFGGGIWCRFAARITLPEPLREAPVETHPTPFSTTLGGTTDA